MKKRNKKFVADDESVVLATKGLICFTAVAFLEAIDEDYYELSDRLERLRDALTVARRIGVAEAEVENILQDVRRSYPDLVETWSEILDEIKVSVWLEGPGGSPLKGETVTVNRYLWEHFEEDLVLDETIQGLLDDFYPSWKVV